MKPLDSLEVTAGVYIGKSALNIIDKRTLVYGWIMILTILLLFIGHK